MLAHGRERDENRGGCKRDGRRVVARLTNGRVQASRIRRVGHRFLGCHAAAGRSGVEVHVGPRIVYELSTTERDSHSERTRTSRRTGSKETDGPSKSPDSRWTSSCTVEASATATQISTIASSQVEAG